MKNRDVMARVTTLIPPSLGEFDLEERRRLSLREPLGRGEAAAVYRAVIDGGARVRRSVAVKIFDGIATDERDEVAARLARAARHAAVIQHPNVADTYEFGVLADRQPFIVMELVEGRPLTALLESLARSGQRVPLDLGLFIATEIAEALIGARLAWTADGQPLGLTHGGLSAREVLLSWHGVVKVTDFGIANASTGTSGVRRVAAMARRASTLAPESAQGAKADARSDVFSLGMMLREMLVGPRFPAAAKDTDKISMARDGHIEPAIFGPQLTLELRAIIERAIEVDPARRYPNAGVFSYDLRRAGMAMGVGDGRLFLRSALQSLAVEETPDATSGERPLATVPPPRDHRFESSLRRRGRSRTD